MSRVRDLSNRTHLVKCYLNDSEYARFRRIAEATKNTNSRLIQWMLEGAIFVEFPPAEFGQVLTELRHIGINLNQLARLFISVDILMTASIVQMPNACGNLKPNSHRSI